ncbi:PREDICTED: vomeronasal type-1 receptor 3-like [Chinchilla lanigera]|uniref:vomeronasal type-1 receptor 3-like n=1 Tax=Chinchilla lanigera TaxID=34839 RepID=UPI0006965371|nr:PREDICTED: vomeronasal type-1 receptor 3-like [Chinchilla lanigera]
MAAFGLKDFLSDVGCKLVFYVHRVGRGVSISTTCLLSVFQAITISPRSSRWAELKVKALKCSGLSNGLCWVLHLLLNVRVAMLVTDRWNNRNITKAVSFQYCSAALPTKSTGFDFGAFTCFHDISCLALMVWASGSMVFTLYRHERQVHHIHRHSSASRPSPGTRASQSILVLCKSNTSSPSAPSLPPDMGISSKESCVSECLYEVLDNHKMSPVDLKFGVVFLVQVVLGTLGNLALLYHYCILYFSGCRSRSTDVILRHLTIANSIVILSRGIPETMAASGLKDFLSDVGCKLVFYVHRVGRGVSISTTCLLSVFQAITISPRSSRWAELKVKALKCSGLSNGLCWVLHLLLNVRVAMLVTDRWNNRNITKAIDFQYCSGTLPDKNAGYLFGALTHFHDVLCMEFIIWASGSMVFNLYRHKQRVHHIHSQNSSSGSSPESRATQSILVLVSAFVSFYAVSSAIHVWFSLHGETAWWLARISAFINACFSEASPFILMSRERRVSRLIWKT